MNQKIILESGNLISLIEWQRSYQINSLSIGNYFSLYEKSYSGYYLWNDKDFLIAKPLIILLDNVRLIQGFPMILSCQFRSLKEQKQLSIKYKKDYPDHKLTANNASPHPEGMAADIICNSHRAVSELVNLLKSTAASLNYKIRIGYKKYSAVGWTMVHVDVCPMYFAPGMPYHEKEHKIHWENEIEW